jgi:hypothetical protein
MILGDVLSGFLTGGLGGLASGLLGITSGGILVPLLVLLNGSDQHVAQGISLVAQVVPTSLSGVRGYRQAGHVVPWRWLGWMAAGFGLGGCVGALLATQVSDRALQWTFVGYLLLLLALLILRSRRSTSAIGSAVDREPAGLPLFAIGLVAGWSSGFLGIGGGLAITALATGLLKLSQHRAQAVSLTVTALPVTLPAAWLYAQQGIALPWATIAALIAGLWLGTGLGARLAIRIDQRRLRGLLIGLIAAMAVAMAFKAS